MKILILCSFFTPYVVQLVDEMSKRYDGFKFSLLTADRVKGQYSKEWTFEYGGCIYYFARGNTIGREETMHQLRKTCECLPEFDIIHTLWFEEYWGYVADILEKKSDFLFGSIGGSDVLRPSPKHVKYNYYLKNRIIKRYNLISGENDYVIDQFYKVFGDVYKQIPLRKIRFGIDILDAFTATNSKSRHEICSTFKLPEDKIIIACGYNGKKEHQHLKMISVILDMPAEVISRCCFLFPMTYDRKESYQNIVEYELEKSGLSYSVIKKFLTTEQMAEYISVTDIMLHFQTTDQLSSTMLAHMYHGNVVITGSWLKYDELVDNGIYFLKCSDFSDLTKTLADVANNLKQYKELCTDNADIVYRESSWDSTSEKWYCAYKDLINKNL